MRLTPAAARICIFAIPALASAALGCRADLRAGPPASGAAGASSGAAGVTGAAGVSVGTAGAGAGGAGGVALAPLVPGRSPLRRLSRVEYDSTVRDLLGDT